MYRIFISSVQSEFAEERRLLKDYIEKSPLLRRFFSVFIFEADVPPSDKRTDAVYLEELRQSHLYIALIGNRYEFGIVIYRKGLGGVNGGVNGGVKKGLTDGMANGLARTVLQAIEKHPGERVPSIAVRTGKSRRTVERCLKDELQNFVEFRGAPKTGGYYVREGGL